MPVGKFLQNRVMGPLSEAESDRLAASIDSLIEIPARQTMVREGAPLDKSSLLLSGMMTRCIDDRAGYRQVVAVHVPGDFVDLHAYPLKRLDHDVVTLTAVRMAIFPHTALDSIVEERPTLTRKLWASTLIDAAVHRQWVFRQGRLDAVGRIAHFLCEMNARFLAIDMSTGLSFRLPMTQADIGEACGLTQVHVNRVLRELRDNAICTARSGIVTIINPRMLSSIGQFDPAYLYLADHVVARLNAINAG